MAARRPQQRIPGAPAQGIRTSGRCRATHDVPYSLRCVLDGPHPMREADGVVLHRDKEGKWWEQKVS